ncbi:unnamed protein product [Blepharisma stoltei]|uniref:Uncharacterized protein n=1 Tax=Blepharisma stoltei TaxID=1481888 RepID=A0AAU9IRW2_9CILI|nr:unnamed protein product [Blepharisma stoltei]
MPLRFKVESGNYNYLSNFATEYAITPLNVKVGRFSKEPYATSIQCWLKKSRNTEKLVDLLLIRKLYQIHFNS